MRVMTEYKGLSGVDDEEEVMVLEYEGRAQRSGQKTRLRRPVIRAG